MEDDSMENIRLSLRSDSSMNNRLEIRKSRRQILSRNPFFNFLRCYRREHPGNVTVTASMAGMIWNKMSDVEKEPFRVEAQHVLYKLREKGGNDKLKKKSRSGSISIKKNKSQKFVSMTESNTSKDTKRTSKSKCDDDEEDDTKSKSRNSLNKRSPFKSRSYSKFSKRAKQSGSNVSFKTTRKKYTRSRSRMKRKKKYGGKIRKRRMRRRKSQCRNKGIISKVFDYIFGKK